MIALRDYQHAAIAALRRSYATGHRAPCLVLPTGAGKTIVASAIIRGAVDRGRRVLFLAHREELLNQTIAKLLAAGIDNLRLIQAARDIGVYGAPVTVASVPTLAGARWRDAMPLADLVVFDECFPAGTLVDGRPIESIRVGDAVRSYNRSTNTVEMRTVKRLFCSRPSKLVTVHLDDGRSITCTAGHPFFDGSDYTPAIHLQPGQSLYGEANEATRMRPVFAAVPRASGHRNTDLLGRVPQGAPGCAPRGSVDAVRGVQIDGDRRGQEPTRACPQDRTSLLLGLVSRSMGRAQQLRDDGAYEPPACEHAHDGTQSDAARRVAAQDAGDAPHSGASSTGARWEWYRSNGDGIPTAGSAAGGMGGEPHRTDEDAARRRLPDARQARSGAPVEQDMHRDRRSEPRLPGTAGAGREEAGLARVVRVDRVEVHEQRGVDGFGPRCADGLVYNIEVDGNRNYFVDGLLVHNCHHVAARTWASIAAHYADAHLLGMTATPQRGDGKALGDIFDDLVVGSTIRDLIALGHLVPCRAWAPSDVLESGELALSPAEAYAQHGRGERAVIFCSTVEQAGETADELTASGVPCAVVHGTMRDRATTLARFRTGELRAIANVHVLTEGWDDPGVSVCILARKFGHAGTFLQAVGRVLRPAPGKTHASLVDLCGSVLQHGTPDAERAYSLDGKAIAAVDREAIRQCSTCGAVFLAADVAAGEGDVAACPQCGVALPARARKEPKSIGVGVAEVPAGTQPTQRWTVALVAKFPGRCAVCKGRVTPGERIFWNKGERPRHEACGRASVPDEANRLMGIAS